MTMNTSIFQRDRILSNRRLIGGNGIIASALDPLAGIQVNLRFQTHRGDRIPVGLYQDVACTVPATTDGDPIAAWRDEFTGSGLVAIQNISSHRPKLRFEEGVPQVEFDGVDDVLILEDHFQEITDCLAVIGFKPLSSPSAGDGAGTALWQFGTMNDGSYWAYEGNTIYDGFGTNSRRSVASPSDLDQQFNTATVRLRSSTSAYWLNGDVLMPEEAVNISWSSSPMIGGMLYDNTRFAGRISSLIVSPLTDDGTRSLIEDHLKSLH